MKDIDNLLHLQHYTVILLSKMAMPVHIKRCPTSRKTINEQTQA